MRLPSVLTRTAAISTLAAAGLAAASSPAQAAISCPRDAPVRFTATGACAYGTISHTTTSLKINMTLLDTGNDGVRAHMDLVLFGRDGFIKWEEKYALGQVNGYGKSIKISRSFAMTSSTFAQLRICAAGISCTPLRYI